MNKISPFPQDQLLQLLGPIDIYLLDQIMKGNLQPSMRILDAGCGHGRNLHYLLQAGYEVYGCDQNKEYIHYVQALAQRLLPEFGTDNIRHEPVEQMSFSDGYFDAVISSAVLHFAQNPQHFGDMMAEMWRVLKPEGLLFIRMASDIGIHDLVKPLGDGRHFLPDGSERYLLTEGAVREWVKENGAWMVEPLKTTNVEYKRCMTTWVMQKKA